ncbi:MAG: EpsG family protein, partial [Pseudomonadota bacterium]
MIVMLLLLHIAFRTVDVYVSMSDFIGYNFLFNQLATDKDVSSLYTSIEPILPGFFYIIGSITGPLNRTDFFLLVSIFISCMLTLLCTRMRINILAVVFVIAFMDLILVYHLFRQFIASVILLIIYINHVRNKRSLVKSGLWCILPALIHSSSFLLLPIMLFSIYARSWLIRCILSISLFGCYAFDLSYLAIYFDSFHYVPVLDKAYYTIIALETGVKGGVRIVAVVACVA